MEGIISFVTSKIVEAAITKLVSMLNPVVGGIIQGALGIYNTIMFFIERMSTMMQVVASFIDSIAAIASGVIAAAANRVEQTLAGLLVLAISFLARLAGLGKVSDAVLNIIKKIRSPVDKALDFVVSWIVKIGKTILDAAKKLIGKVTGKKDKPDERTEDQKPADVKKAIVEADALLSDEKLSLEDVARRLPAIQSKYRLTKLVIVTEAKNQESETDHIEGAASPIERGGHRGKSSQKMDKLRLA